MKRHVRDSYYIVHEGVYQQTYPQPGSESDPGGGHETCHPPTDMEDLRKFRFSRIGAKGTALPESVLQKLGQAMTGRDDNVDSSAPAIPAGYTYLGQFIDHDLTMDKTDKAFRTNVTVEELVQGRSPALDLDCVYGLGPTHPDDAKFYEADGIRLKMGTTAAVGFPPGVPVNVDRDGFDLPRTGTGTPKSERQRALIPDHRNDENLAVAQTHLAFIRLHNRVVAQLAADGVSSSVLFETARALVIKHYQWMLKTDFLPRIVDQQMVDDVFTNGRRIFEPAPLPGCAPTMPIEFSVAAFRLGHSMIRGAYDWNVVFSDGGAGGRAGLDLLFRFSGTSGNLSPDGDLNDPNSGSFDRLPTNWIADFRRLYDFPDAGFAALKAPDDQLNLTKRIDTRLVDPLQALPIGAFGGTPATPPIELNLAFRNLVRATMVELASGQQIALHLDVPILGAQQLLEGDGGVVLSTANGFSQDELDAIVANTPLWFYILREAEVNGGKLAAVGGRLVTEVFHRAMEGSTVSIVRDPVFQPSLGPDPSTFRMVDLLLAGCTDKDNPVELFPLG